MVEGPVVLKYSGANFDRGQMDAYLAADALVGFAKLAEISGTMAYGRECKVNAQIHGFSRGSSELKLLVDVVNISAQFFAMVAAPNDIFNLISGAIELFKFLKGEPPKSVKKADNAAYDGGVVVENNFGETTVVNGNVFNIVMNESAGDAVEKFIRKSVKKDGDAIDVLYNGKSIAKVAGEEGQYFRRLPAGEKLAEYTAEMVVRIASPVLEGTSRWKFHDGRGLLSASIEDEDFLERVSEGKERFGAGDILRVRMRCIQRMEKKKPKPEYVVEEVLAHVEYEGGDNIFPMFNED